MRKLLETEQKALEINLDPLIYGTFAEIGAGQEVAPARSSLRINIPGSTLVQRLMTCTHYSRVYRRKSMHHSRKNPSPK